MSYVKQSISHRWSLKKCNILLNNDTMGAFQPYFGSLQLRPLKMQSLKKLSKSGTRLRTTGSLDLSFVIELSSMKNFSAGSSSSKAYIGVCVSRSFVGWLLGTAELFVIEFSTADFKSDPFVFGRLLSWATGTE